MKKNGIKMMALVLTVTAAVAMPQTSVFAADFLTPKQVQEVSDVYLADSTTLSLYLMDETSETGESESSTPESESSTETETDKNQDSTETETDKNQDSTETETGKNQASTETGTGKGSKTDTAKTGDMAKTGFWTVLAGLGLVGIVEILRRRLTK